MRRLRRARMVTVASHSASLMMASSPTWGTPTVRVVGGVKTSWMLPGLRCKGGAAGSGGSLPTANVSAGLEDPLVPLPAASGVPLGVALKSLLMAVAGNPGQLGYIIDAGVITVATRDSLKEKWQTHVYDIRDLF